MKNYTVPEMEVTRLNVEDIVTTSTCPTKEENETER